MSNLLPLDAYCADTKSKELLTDDFVEKRKIKVEGISDISSDEQSSSEKDSLKRKHDEEYENFLLKRQKRNRERSKRRKQKRNEKDTEKEKSSTNIKVENVEVKKEEQSLEEGELGEEEERVLEEGELPEDQNEPSVGHTSLIKMSKPLDFDDFNRKRKVALLIAYCGAGFHGMQKNPDVETIELKLIEALTAIKAIKEEHKTDYLVKNLNNLSFQRAARTDKGVSAARQVVSLKISYFVVIKSVGKKVCSKTLMSNFSFTFLFLILYVIAKADFVEDINKHLPPEIRVFGIERVTKKFDAKCLCSGRSYEYLVPSFAFAPSKDTMEGSYRLPTAQLEKVNKILGSFVGTHNFHNFTSGKHFRDKSAYRYIIQFKADKPFECRSHEFVAIEIVGQSFMIHQIRKMVGLCIAICRGYCEEDIIEKAFEARKLDIPKAPGLGLLLNRVKFDQYNRKVVAEGERNALNFDYAEFDINHFKLEKIWHSIIEEEIKKSSLVLWLKTLVNHTYSETGMIAPDKKWIAPDKKM